MKSSLLAKLLLAASIAIGAAGCPDETSRPAPVVEEAPAQVESPELHPANQPAPPAARPASPAATPAPAPPPGPAAGSAPPLDAAHLDMAGHPCQCGGECHCGHCSGMIAGCHCKPKRADGK